MKPFTVITLIVLICLASTARADTVEERAQFRPGGGVEIQNVSGSVEVRGWNRNQIEIEVDLSSSRDQVEFEVSDDIAYVGVRKKRDDGKRKHHHGQHGSADMVIRIPANTRVSVNSVSADIDVQGTEGKQRLESVSGDIESQLNAHEATFRSVSGEIEVEATKNSVERVSAHSVSGDIELSNVGGEIRVNTVSGDITVTAGSFRRLDGETVSGDLEITGNFERGGEIEFESVNGELYLEVPSLYDTEFDLESFNGSISPIFNHRARRTSRYAPGRELRLTEGDGSSQIRIETLNGDIEIVSTGKSRRTPKLTVVSARKPGENDRDDD